MLIASERLILVMIEISEPTGITEAYFVSVTVIVIEDTEKTRLGMTNLITITVVMNDVTEESSSAVAVFSHNYTSLIKTFLIYIALRKIRIRESKMSYQFPPYIF